MNFTAVKQFCGGVSLLALSVSGAAAADQEVDRLRAENLRLKAQLQAVQQSCAAPAAAAATAPVPPVAASTQLPVIARSPAASTAVPPPMAAPAAPSAAPLEKGTEPAAPPAAAAVVPQGYKLVPVNTPDYIDPMAPPYDRTGCSRGPFKGPPPAKWNEAGNWLGLERGQSETEVESLLGKEHFTASGKGRTEWQYGRCGDTVNGRVMFENGKVLSWQIPDL